MQNQIKQVWIPYYEWEDYLNGMWDRSVNNEFKLLTKAVEFTSNHILYGSAMLKVIDAWPKTMINSLTNKSINQKAFVGHCAVSFELGIPEYITRKAWKELTDKQRVLADNEALKAILIWRKKYLATLKNGNQNAIQKEYQTQLL